MASTVDAALGPPSAASDKPWIGTGAALLPTYVALCLVSLLPLLLTEHPPIVDFANHAARLFLACNMDNPAISAMYQYRLGIIPNLAIDVINLPLCNVAAPATILKSVTAAALATIYLSAWVLQRKLFGTPGPMLWVLPAIAMNLVTTMGYSNFLVGVALSFLLVAVTIDRDQSFGRLLLLCNLTGTAIFFSHIFALAFAVIFFLGRMIARETRTPRGLVIAGLRTIALFALPLLLIFFVAGDGKALTIGYFGKIRIVVAAFMTPNLSFGLLSALIYVPIYVLVREKMVYIHSELRIPLALLAIYVLVVPNVLQDAVDVDTRTFVALTYLFLASLQIQQFRPQIASGLLVLSVLSVGLQLREGLTSWQTYSKQVAEFRQGTDVLPAGARVLSMFGSEAERNPGKLPVMPLSYIHVGSYATVDRQVFNPLEFTGVGMQPLSPTSAFARIDTPASSPLNSEQMRLLAQPTPDIVQAAANTHVAYALNWPGRFDYIIYYHFGKPVTFDGPLLTEVKRGSFFSIMRINKAGRGR